MNIRNLLLLAILCPTSLFGQTKKDFLHPTNDNRMKTWWFFGYENTTKEGITADVEALKAAGYGGVVYYDQNHRPLPTSPKGRSLNSDNPSDNKGIKDSLPRGGQGVALPDEGFSPQWWDNLKFACTEANRVGLSFEINISNGYCAGGKWIDPQHAMQRVASAKANVTGGKHVNIPLPNIKGIENYVKDIAILAFPVHTGLSGKSSSSSIIRHFTARYNPKGKGRNGSMQKPASNKITKGSLSPEGERAGERGFSGYGWVDVPNIGTLQVSDDSLNWRDVITIEPMYSSQGGYFYRTNAFPATEGKYWRVNYTNDQQLREWSIGPEAMFDRWEERTGLHSDFAEDSRTPEYSDEEIIHSSDIIDLSQYIHDGKLDWDAPEGEWQIVRLASVLTGAKSKHGRPNLLGYECDKLSVEAAELHWNSYTQIIIDTLTLLSKQAPSLRGRAGGEASLIGVTMDSHEGGAQNWTPLMMQEFESRRGYSLKPYLLMLAGYVVDSKEKTEQVLYDFRQTISDCVRENYFGTFQRLATKNGLTFTAQAIGNALCIDGDAVSVKKVVDKPQGEFWTYQKDGAYDIKDCSSACHLYGKPIASAEAMTDAMYDTNPEDLKRVADIAFSMGAQEFVVCATPHIPAPLRPTGTSPMGEDKYQSTPYIAGREYAINRSNPKWNDMKWVWETSARSTYMLRQGKAAPDALIFLGDDVPIKTLTCRLPDGIEGLDWDVCTGDALGLTKPSSPNAQTQSGTQREGCLNAKCVTPGGISYSALIIEKQAHINSASQAKIDELRKAGVPVLTTGESIERPITITDENGNTLDSQTIVHTHRIVEGKDMYFLANITKKPITIKVKCNLSQDKPQLWQTATGKTSKLKANADGTFTISLDNNESVFIY